MLRSLVGSEMCIRDRCRGVDVVQCGGVDVVQCGGVVIIQCRGVGTVLCSGVGVVQRSGVGVFQFRGLGIVQRSSVCAFGRWFPHSMCCGGANRENGFHISSLGPITVILPLPCPLAPSHSRQWPLAAIVKGEGQSSLPPAQGEGCLLYTSPSPRDS